MPPKRDSRSDNRMHAKVSQRGGGGQALPGLYKQLSFVHASATQIQEMVPDGEIMNFRKKFWSVVLTAQPRFEFSELQNESITYWISVFYKWSQERLAGKMQIVVNMPQLKAILSIPQATTMSIVKIFDPDGHNLLDERGTTQANLKKVRVNVVEVMCAGVLVSKMISMHHKLTFLYGLFDFDSSGVLSEIEFTSFLKKLGNSIGIVLSINKDEHPSTQEMKSFATSIFKQIDKNNNGSVDLEELVEWTLEEGSENSHAVYFKLLLRRFSAERYGSSPDMFDDGITNFRLSWNQPKLPSCNPSCPKHGKAILSCTILSREDVVAVKSFYEELQLGYRQPGLRATSQNPELHKTLTQVVDLLSNRYGTFDITALFRALCPCAQAKHIKMFLNWCDQHGKFVQIEEDLQLIHKGRSDFDDHFSKPTMPDDVMQALTKQFVKMAGSVDGIVRPEDLQRHWGWSGDDVRELTSKFDINGDDSIDQLEFLHMMCPPEYRMDMNDALLHQLFSKWLHAEAELRNKVVQSKTGGDPNVQVSSDLQEWQTPAGLLPMAPAHLIQVWESVYSSIDKDRSGQVDSRELSNLVNDEFGQLICHLLNQGSAGCFSLNDFLFAMCWVHGYCPPPWLKALEKPVQKLRTYST